MNAVILSRVDHLDYELSETLKVASCIGYRFDMDVLAHAMDCNMDALSGFLDLLEEKNFLEILTNENNTDNKTYKYKEHAVFGSIKTLLMGSQKVIIHSKILHFLEITGCLDDKLLAHHAEESERYQEAAMFFEKSTAKSLDSYDYPTAYSSLVKAISLRENGDLDKSPMPELAVREGNLRLLILKRSLGDILRQMARYKEAEDVLLECLKLFSEKADEEADWVFKRDILSTIGILFKERGEYDRALEYLGTMLEISKKRHQPDDLQLASALSQYAEVLRKQLKIDESLEMHQEALNICLSNYYTQKSEKNRSLVSDKRVAK